jgi:hypothetical protein
VLERVIDDWLTNVGERGFESAFSQLLLAEGYRVLHHPAHHPMEHGKDLLALTPDGALFGYQLKGGDIDLKKLESLQQQLWALAATALTYPGIEPPRRPDRAALVTTGRLSPPARDRVSAINTGNKSAGLPMIEVIEREHLVARFTSAHGHYLPTEIADLRRLLNLYAADGRDPLPVRDFARLIRDVLKPEEQKSGLDHRRSIATASLTGAIASAPWHSESNHHAVIEAQAVIATQVLYAASVHELPERVWEVSYHLAMEGARAAVNALLDEAAEAEDLVVPDLVDGVVYPARAATVIGDLAAGIVSGAIEGDARRRLAVAIIRRELPFAKVFCEASIPHFFLAALVLEAEGHADEAATMLVRIAGELAKANQPGSPDAIADPYHSLESQLRHIVGLDQASELSDERFGGNVYTLRPLLDWMIRRNLRQVVDMFWPMASKLTCCEFVPSSSSRFLSIEDDDGETLLHLLPTPASWASLRAEATSIHENSLPGTIWRNIEVLPYLVLLLPYRFTTLTAKAIEYDYLRNAEVIFDD